VIKANTGATIGEIRILVDTAPDRQIYYVDLARQIIGIRPGDGLTASTVETAIEALTLSHRFAAIDVDVVPDADGDTLVFQLTPYRFIKDIRITGQYPLFERDILNQMTLYPGDPYTRADLTAQIDAIVARYRREGYIDPKITVRAQRDPDDENAVVRVDIDKGDHYRLGTLRFEGNQSISAGMLKWRMLVWRSARVPGVGRFSEYRLKNDVDNLVKVYRRKGFADASVSYHMGAPDEANRVDVTVRIVEGRRYRLTFEGNRRFWDLTLKKDVTLFSEGNRNNTGVRKSVRNMLERYRSAGYPDARIEAVVDDTAETSGEIRGLRFVIQEGLQRVVEEVAIAGNTSIPEKTIRKQMLTRPPTLFHDGALDPETLETDVYAVTTLYLKEGFQDRKVGAQTTDLEAATQADHIPVAVAMTIDEGPRTTVRSIAITGLTVVPESVARQRLVHDIGAPFRQAALEVEKEAITSLVAEQGYPHASVTARVTLSDDQTQADIIHEVDPGPKVFLGQVFISGNLRTKETIIRRELEVQPNEPLSLQQLHDGQRRLRDLEIFHGVAYRTIGLKEMEDTVNLFVEVEENKPYYAQISGGYESDSGFFGRTRIGDQNLFGRNKHLWAGGKISQTGYRVETRLTEPRFLNTRTTASIGAFNEELTEFNQPFGTRTTGGSLAFGRDWGRRISASLTFSLERRDQFRVEDSLADLSEEGSRTIFVTTPYIRYDSRDSFVRPTRGLLTSLSVDISKGVEDQVDDFVRYTFDARYYYSLFEPLTLAALARVGQVVPYGEGDLVPSDQLFFLGGIRDVRGFDENLLRFDRLGDPVGGKTAIAGSLEARIDLGMNFELTAFFDIGSVQDALVDEGSDRFRPSVGVGLRYITPIGPMGLLYGHKLDREDGESAGQVHISIGYSF
jgi:outer membrane protein insertion porin family